MAIDETCPEFECCLCTFEDEVSILTGLTLTKVENKDDIELIFNSSDGRKFLMFHEQDCCERVSIDDINGNLADLENTPIILAEEVANDFPKKTLDCDESFTCDDSFTWTFYRFRTIKGTVCIKWYGTSNGYYSTRVSFEEILNGTEIN